jgi:hypothetical protein
VLSKGNRWAGKRESTMVGLLESLLEQKLVENLAVSWAWMMVKRKVDEKVATLVLWKGEMKETLLDVKRVWKSAWHLEYQWELKKET